MSTGTLVAPIAAREGAEPRAIGESKPEKRKQKRRLDAARPLDPWERYRALVDASEEAFDLIDITNREARFALIVMGALNAVPLVLISRADASALLSRGELYVVVGVFLGYVLLLLSFILSAIEALRPGRFRPALDAWPSDALHRPAGIRYYEDVVQRSAHEHWAAWQTVRISQLNADVAMQVHSLALKNHARHGAVRRLYAGLRVMALALAAQGLLFVVLAWT